MEETEDRILLFSIDIRVYSVFGILFRILAELLSSWNVVCFMKCFPFAIFLLSWRTTYNNIGLCQIFSLYRDLIV